jgi:hypothetical protein
MELVFSLSLPQSRRQLALDVWRFYLRISLSKQSHSNFARRVHAMVTSAVDLVVTATSLAENVVMVTSVVKVEKAVAIVHVVLSLRHLLNFHSVQSQSASSHVV